MDSSKVVMKDTVNIEWNDWFIYDETSPTFLRWKVDRYRGRNLAQLIITAGSVAGTNCKDRPDFQSYSSVTLNDTTYSVHRIIYEMLVDRLTKNDYIDHIDGDRQNNSINNLRKVDRKGNARNVALQSRSSTGVVGVNYNDKGRWGDYYVAAWRDLDGKRKSKHFRISVLGKQVAFEMACAARLMAIEDLNRQGAGYSERHGL